MITANTEVVIVYDVVKKVRPEGLIIKNDITPEKLQQAVIDIIAEEQYYGLANFTCIKS